MLHAVIVAAAQLVIGHLTGEWWLVGSVLAVFYIAREHTQAEYRWIETYGLGLRANMPWWGGFDRRVWNRKSLLDWAAPAVTAVAIALLMG